MTTLPERLKAWRSARQLSQPKAAQSLGVEVSTYRKWEYGLRHPSGAAMALIERVLAESPGFSADALEALQRDNDKAIEQMTEQQKGEQ